MGRGREYTSPAARWATGRPRRLTRDRPDPIVAAVSASGARRPAGAEGRRLDWLDGVKGLAILWIVFFHFFTFYDHGRTPWPLHPGYLAAYETRCAPDGGRALCLGGALLSAVAQLGFHAVSVFLVLSGFADVLLLVAGCCIWEGSRLARRTAIAYAAVAIPLGLFDLGSA